MNSLTPQYVLNILRTAGVEATELEAIMVATRVNTKAAHAGFPEDSFTLAAIQAELEAYRQEQG